MVGFARGLLLGLGLIAFGWIGGSIFPAPGEWAAAIKGRAAPVLSRLDLSPEALARLRGTLSAEEFAVLSRNATRLAASTGDVIMVDSSGDDEHVDAVSSTPMAPLPAGADVFERSLRICPGMTVANAPPTDARREIRGYAKFVAVNGLAIAVNPTHGACLSSGVGQRDGRPHKGIDLHARDGGPIFAAAAGVVLEKLYRNDYGNMVLINHGHGVYTRYAHLSSFSPGLAVGAHVAQGEQIGLMGNTAGYQIPVHLHYELLLGDYANAHASFGLTPHSPFSYPAADAQLIAAAPAPQPSQVAAAAPPRPARGATAVAAIPPPRTPAPAPDHTPLPPVRAQSASAPDATIVTVQRGDTLSRIAQRQFGRASAWAMVAQCNAFLGQRNRGDVSPLHGGDLLYIGDDLVMPEEDGSCPS